MKRDNGNKRSWFHELNGFGDAIANLPSPKFRDTPVEDKRDDAAVKRARKAAKRLKEKQ